MAKPATNYATFVKGIVTEASPLTFPENASVDERNFILERDGSRRRRLGMDFEEGYAEGSALPNATLEDLAVATSEWKGVANDATVNFAVVQAGTTLYFYDLSTTAISANIKNFTVDLNVHKTAYAVNIGSQPVSTSVGKGVLFVASNEIDPFYLEYDATLDAITATPIVIEVRDFLGVDDNLAVDNRPAVTTAAHTYNLYNQGWTATDIATYLAAQSVNPSNSDIAELGKDSDDVFTPALLDKQYFGNTPAPKGHFIIEPFERIRTGVPNETDEGRPEAVSFYAGRVWYSGIHSKPSGNAPSISGSVYYSQSLTSLDKAGYCHQEADPTSENISELVDTDGGVIEIPEAGHILKLVPLRDSLVIFADNGVWQISGGGVAFTGTNFQVDKLTTVGATNAGGIIPVEAVVVYWTTSGIYILEAQTATHILGARSLSEESIETLYNAIPNVAKLNVIGSYDTTAKRISWLYNDTAGYDGVAYRYRYNKELILDGVLQAFYIHEISDLASLSPYVAGVVSSPELLVGDTPYQVQENGVDVQASGVDVEITIKSPVRGALSTKYLCINPSATTSTITWGEYSNTSFLDWEQADSVGITFLSYLITGYELFQDISREKYVPYITCHFSRTETGFVTNAQGGLDPNNPSGCYLQAQWEWSNSAAGGRWGTAQQVYRLPRLYIPSGAGDLFDDGFSVCTTKSKLRGRGIAVSLYFYSETRKDCHILGWSMAGMGKKDV